MQNQKDLGSLFSKQPANYYRLPNAKWILFQIDTGYRSVLMDCLTELTSSYFEQEGICYGGILNPADMDEHCRMLYQLMYQEDKTIVLTGCSPEWIAGMQRCYDRNFHPYRIGLVSDKTSTCAHADLNSIYLKNLHLLGYQRHIQSEFNSPVLQSIRLGEIRTSSNCIEPFIRMSEMIYFDLNAIRYSDCPANYSLNPSGLHAEEAAGISRMMGMGDRVKCLMISDWDEPKDVHAVTAQLVAQMIWYFWEGCHLKHLDKSFNKDQLTQYRVQLHQIDYVINFYKSENSGKWWFEEPLIDNEFANQLIPCTYEEYLMTAKDQIPKRILEKING